MPLVTTKGMLKAALEGHFAVGAFNANNMEMVQAIVEAATEERAPVILQVSQGAIRYAGLPFAAGIERSPFLWYLERSGHYDLYEIPGKYAAGRPPLPPLNGNSSVRRELFYKVGRYDELFRHYGGEDLELGYRLARAGVKLERHGNGCFKNFRELVY